MNELQERKKQWLSRAKSAGQKLNALQTILKREERLLHEIQSFENCSELFQHICKLKFKKQLQITSLLAIQEEVASQIEAVPDMELQTILIRRYLIGETMEQIAEAMFYDLRTVQRKHKKALDSLTIAEI